MIPPRCLVVPALAATLLAATMLVACGEPSTGELREWQASDHQEPSAGEPDSTGRAAPPEDADPAATEERAATALFRAMCGSCHGEGGRGDGPGRPPVAQIPDLTSPAWQASRTDEQIAQAITLGVGGFMPAFGEQLSAPGIAALVRHTRRLGGAAPSAPAEPTAEPAAEPTTEPTAAEPAAEPSPTEPAAGETPPGSP